MGRIYTQRSLACRRVGGFNEINRNQLLPVRMLLASTSVGGIHFRSGFPSLDIGISGGRTVFFGCTTNTVITGTGLIDGGSI